MSCLQYHDGQLYIEDVSLASIADKYGTPAYVYSKAEILKNWEGFTNQLQPIPHQICYAVKANANLSLLKLFSELGCGFDIVSRGELERVLYAHGNPDKIVFSGVGKRSDEIEFALQKRIHCIDIESEPELERVHQIAEKLNVTASIALRINPDIDANTHAHISTGLKENKFGIDINSIAHFLSRLEKLPHLKLIGIATHIGSQITTLNPFILAVDRMLAVFETIKERGMTINEINMGGGLGISYHDETPPSVGSYSDVLIDKLRNHNIKLILEPGRALIGNAGILLTQIEYIKQTQHKQFAIVDAGMNDLIRPALYDAWQPILPVKERSGDKSNYDIAGPVCESADFLGLDRDLSIEAGDLLAIDCAGAYGFSMSSNYNSRPRPCEILVADDQTILIRKRETIADLFQHEL